MPTVADANVDPIRPLAWIDDAHDDACAEWCERRRGPTILVTTEPATGITAAEADQLRAWAAGLRGGSPSDA